MENLSSIEAVVEAYRRGHISLQDLFVIRQDQLRATFEELVDRVPNHRASILVQIKWGNVFRLTDYWLAVLAHVLQLPLAEFSVAHREHLQRLAIRQLFAVQTGEERQSQVAGQRALDQHPSTLAQQQWLLAQRINAAITQSNLTIRSAAELIGITPTSLWRYSQGKSVPGPEVWRVISRTFNLDISDLPLIEQTIATTTTKGRQPKIFAGRQS